MYCLYDDQYSFYKIYCIDKINFRSILDLNENTKLSIRPKMTYEYFWVLDISLLILKNNCGISLQPYSKTIRLSEVAPVAPGEAAAYGETAWDDV